MSTKIELNILFQVYETIETMILNPDELIRNTVQPDSSPAEEFKNRFKKLSTIFGGKDRQPGKPANVDDNQTRQSFSSIFSKKPPKHGNASPADKAASSVENDWTIV